MGAGGVGAEVWMGHVWDGRQRCDRQEVWDCGRVLDEVRVG